MAASETAIANSALSKLGADRIVDITDGSKEARLLKEQYPKIRDALLREHPWNFAIVRTLLAVSSTTPSHEFTYQYPLPTDCMRVLEVDIEDIDWRLESGNILTDSNECPITYIKKVVETGLFDSLFSEVLATKLAADVCYAITQSTTLRAELIKEYKDMLRDARTFDGQESGIYRVRARDWIDSRY